MEKIKLNVASASLNQTVVNFTRNVPNILAAIDEAVAKKADVLSLQELCLTGYSGDDYFKWIHTDRQQQEMLDLLLYIAEYAASRDPNLVISLGFPFFYADKSQPVKIDLGTKEAPAFADNPLYNINNRPFNAVATLSGGKLHAISAKSLQPDGPAEYEPRQFTSWPDYMGVRQLTLANGQTVPVGKVVAQLGQGDQAITLYHEICAEGWPGIYDDGTVNEKEMREGRYLSRLVKTHDISLTLNPSASKPEPFLNKPGLRQTLCKTGSYLTGGAYAYTNCSGVEAAPAAFEAGSLFAQDGEIVHRGERYNMADVIYSATTFDVPIARKGTPDVVIPHDFQASQDIRVGGPAAWEQRTGKAREAEEISRNIGLWLRDYLKKTQQQGYFISLSGGQDSAFGAVMITQMIDLNLDQLEKITGSRSQAIEAFIDQFDHLEYADEVKQVNKAQGVDAALALIKSKMLTCAYLPGENSSKITQDAARFLIEGGTLVDVMVTDANGKDVAKQYLYDPEFDTIDGDRFTKALSLKDTETSRITAIHRDVKGIGGTFHVVPVQDVIDSYLETFAGVDKQGLSHKRKELLRAEFKEVVDGTREALSPEFARLVSRRIPSWANKSDDLLLQNIQARARLPMAWLFGNDERKIACVTSNWSEAVAGYWTFGGDGHMGSINIPGGVPKSELRDVLKHLETQGLEGLASIPSLSLINRNSASAELRPLKNGVIAQFDEDDMMPYEQLDAIARSIIIDKNSPVDAYHALRHQQPTFKDGSPLFRSNEELIACIDECCWRWHSSQFKRVASVIAPFLGQNVDPHTAVRTTIIGDGFQIGRALLKLEYIKEQLGGDIAFAAHVGQDFSKMTLRTRIERGLRSAIQQTPLNELSDKIIQPDFIKQTPFNPIVMSA